VHARLIHRPDLQQARVAAMLLLTLRGTPTIYQGEEIGMADVPIPFELVQDPFERNVPGLGEGRDPERTPMPWSAAPGGGFTTGRPWLPLNADSAVLNVAAQAAEPRSMLSLYRALLRLRRETECLVSGALRLLPATAHVLAYERRLGDDCVRVLLNMSDRPQSWPQGAAPSQRLLSTYLDGGDATGERLALRANEGLIVRERSS
jgi:alpha-glucosidase